MQYDIIVKIQNCNIYILYITSVINNVNLIYPNYIYYLGLIPVRGDSLIRGELPRRAVFHSLRDFVTGLITDIVCPLSRKGIGKGGNVEGSGLSSF